MSKQTAKGVSAAGQCPCGTGRNYADCCQIYLTGKRTPQTAEQLMRSRYSAYLIGSVDYLYQTTHPDQRTAKLQTEIVAWAEQVEFTRLEIVSVQQGQLHDKLGKVEFIAHYRQLQQTGKLHELSRFRRYQRRWYYFDGSIY